MARGVPAHRKGLRLIQYFRLYSHISMTDLRLLLASASFCQLLLAAASCR